MCQYAGLQKAHFDIENIMNRSENQGYVIKRLQTKP